MNRRRTLPAQLKQAINTMLTENAFSSELLTEITRKMSSVPLELLLPIVSKNNQIISCIKLLILIHNIVLQDSKCRDKAIDELIRAVCVTLDPQSTSFEKILFEKLIVPYKLYLQKRNLYNQVEVYRQSRGSQPYIIINLIQSGLGFINIIFTLGRYLLKHYKFLNEFNIVIAKDMSMLYQKLKKKMSAEFCLFHADILETINENLFIVFYNCYFSRCVSCYAPVWIDTEHLMSLLQQENKSIMKKSRRQNNTFRELEQEISQCDSSYNLSICSIQSNSNESSILDMKSVSTIASHREVNREDQLSQKQIKERLEFIAEASMLLNGYRQSQVVSEQNITSLAAF